MSLAKNAVMMAPRAWRRCALSEDFQPFLCSLGLTITSIGYLVRRQAKVSLSTSVEGLADYLETQPESAELMLQARRVGTLR